MTASGAINQEDSMEIELFEIRNHLSRYRPFRDLPPGVLDDLVPHVEVTYFKAGRTILELGQDNRFLYFIRSGAVEVTRSSGELYNRFGEGDCFGQFALMRSKRVRYPVKALEDTLVYLVPDIQFQYLCEHFDSFADHMEEDHGSRLRQAVKNARHEGYHPLLASPVQKLIRRRIVTASPAVTVEEAARIMTQARVSALLIMDDAAPEEDQDTIAGLITDRDLRARVLASGLALSTPVRAVMSTKIVSCRSDDYAFEAMLTMMRHNLHHLPVLHKARAVGMITASDIVQYESHSSVYLVGEIFKQKDLDGLTAVSEKVRLSFVQMVNEDANSHMIGSALSLIASSISQRLLQLGETRLGEPPVPYCYLSLGSMARQEQLIVSDQDNAFILDDSFIAEQHDAYFTDLAAFVSDGLAACGYGYCGGGIMGTNPRWRQPLKAWAAMFNDWIDDPDPEALLHSSIFFDLDGIYGQLKLAESLKRLIREKAPQSRKFLAHIARNALLRNPPLGFFRQFVLEPNGEHINTFDLKERGTAPISDLVRVHALACGSRSLNSLERLADINETHLLPEGVGSDLIDALEFISMVRIRHQAKQIEAGIAPDNNVEPKRLSAFERQHLRNAFQIVDKGQAFLRYRYTASNGMREIK
jgi:CBS domain-containing protein